MMHKEAVSWFIQCIPRIYAGKEKNPMGDFIASSSTFSLMLFPWSIAIVIPNANFKILN